MKTVGNSSLSSNEEERVAEMLREKNLKHTNEISPSVHPKNTFYTRHGKRVLDVLISFPVFVILLPFNMVFGVLTFFDVVTKFGKIMRKFSLDELLNFWSVLKGDMSIIGPRPLPVFIYDRMSERHKMRTAVRPGLECPRVIELDYEDTCKYQRTYENDIWYVEHVSFLQDIRMVFLLVKMVFTFGRREEQAVGDGVSYFVGYDEDGHAMSMNKYRIVMAEKEKGKEDPT